MVLATHQDLSKMVKDGTFRKDLYDRITQFVYKIPSLEENISLKKDLIIKFWNMFCEIHQKKMELNHEIIDLLLSCPMEGNVRELKQVIEKIILLSFSYDSIQSLVKLTSPNQGSRLTEESYPDHYYEAKEKFERAYFEKKYAEFNGKVNLMAKKTNLSKVTLLSKLKHYDLKKHYV
jgi:two-component system NtrC family response regulator